MKAFLKGSLNASPCPNYNSSFQENGGIADISAKTKSL